MTKRKHSTFPINIKHRTPHAFTRTQQDIKNPGGLRDFFISYLAPSQVFRSYFQLAYQADCSSTKVPINLFFRNSKSVLVTGDGPEIIRTPPYPSPLGHSTFPTEHPMHSQSCNKISKFRLGPLSF